MPEFRRVMPIFLWEAKACGGEVRGGEMEAPDLATARQRLRQQGLAIVKVKKKSIEIVLSGMAPKVTTKDLVCSNNPTHGRFLTAVS